MIAGDPRPHREVLLAECVEAYEVAHKDIYGRLIHINTSVEILETISRFPLRHLLSPDEPFFELLYWNFTYTCVIMLHALLEGSERCGIIAFKNRLLREWLPEHERQALIHRLRGARFTPEAKRVRSRAAQMRHRVIAHRDPGVVNGSLRIPGLTIGDLRALCEETEALFGLCCFEIEYVTSLYPGGTAGGTPVETDVERIMRLLVRHSTWLTLPDSRRERWAEDRRHMSQTELDELNRWRVQLGLAEA